MSENYSPLLELTRTWLLGIVREPGIIFWVFVFPVLLAVALGIAFRSRPPEAARVAVADGEQAAATVERLSTSNVDAALLPSDRADDALRTGQVDLVIIPGPTGGTQPSYTYRYDPTRPQAEAVKLQVDAVLQSSHGREDPALIEVLHVTQPGARYIDFLLPGLIGLNLMGSSMWGIGFALVMARTRKMLKRLAATPMRRSHYLLATGLSRLVLLALELVALVAFGTWAFGVRVHGSLFDLAVVALLGASAFAGLALLVSARPRNIEVASGLMNFVMLPMWVLSGSFFSYERFPEVLHPAIRVLPLTALNGGLRAVMTEGASLAALGPEMGILAAWGTVSFAVALKLFRWQ